MYHFHWCDKNFNIIIVVVVFDHHLNTFTCHIRTNLVPVVDVDVDVVIFIPQVCEEFLGLNLPIHGEVIVFLCFCFVFYTLADYRC